MTKRPAIQVAQALIVGLLVSGCGGGSGGTPPQATAISKTGGDGQAGIVGQPLADPLIVVVAEDGSPSPGTTVAWSTTAPGGSVSPASAVADASGAAATQWTLGTVPGSQTATASLAGADGSPVTFTATAVAGPATAVAKASGDGQTGEIFSQLALPVQARVTDQHGNAVQGTAVAWSATGGTVSSPSVATNASGLSSVNVTAGGAEGPIVITATADGLTGSPLTFNATAVVTPPPPASIAVSVGNDFFRSERNQTIAPAVDTVAVGGSVTWTWVVAAASHNVTSNPPPGFTSSPTQAAGTTHTVSFPAAGAYRYYCNIHSSAAATGGMSGRIVVR